MQIEQLFGEVGLGRFIEGHLHRLPLALPAVAHAIAPLGSWDALGPIFAATDADVMVVRQGARVDGATPTSADAARKLCDSGCTILIRHAERHHAAIAELAATFSQAFRGPVDVHAYVTPPGSFGFSWHYDAEDVFILQTSGEKEYFLRKNTVHPWPLEETMPADMQYERELMPLMRVVLRAGDMLYIPCGYWHRAQATETDGAAISLAVGVMSPSAMDLFDLLRDEMLKSLVWRQRLPLDDSVVADSAAEPRTAYTHILDQLAAELARTMTDRRFHDQVVQRFAGNRARDGESNGASQPARASDR